MATDAKQKRLWFVSRNGNAGYIDKDFRIKVFDKRHGLPENAMNTIALDARGYCYVGIPGEGVYYASPFSKPEKVNFRKVVVAGKSYSTNIYAMICDSKGNLWLGTEIWSNQFVKDQSSESFAEVVHFKREDGFLGLENCHNSILTDGSDNIWFGTMNGLVHYNPAYNWHKLPSQTTFSRHPIV